MKTLSFVGKPAELMKYLKDIVWDNNKFAQDWKEKLQNRDEYTMSNCCDAPIQNGRCWDCKEGVN